MIFQGFQSLSVQRKAIGDNCISRLFGTIDSFYDLSDSTVTTTGKDSFDIDTTKIMLIKKKIQENIYTSSIALKDGTRYRVNIGSPVIKTDCPAYNEI
ncbi:MAG: hypothetical protein R3E95_14475 [Thiolinea sp.]